ncbi:MAG: ABC transporter permease [Acidimicrobiales bacterium]|nr:ABC transporter permease [Acidimicrobiales bacterium]
MKLALLELRRRPGRFAVIGTALVLLVLLMLFLGNIRSGLFLGSTGAIRIHEADRYVFSEDARESILRSEVTEVGLRELERIDGVADARGFGVSLLGVQIPGESEVADGAIGGYEAAGGRLPEPPPIGQGLADEGFQDLGLSLGETVLVGPAEVPVEVIGWIDDSNYLLQNGLWVNGETWRQIQNANRPDAIIGPDEWQIALVDFAASADAAATTAAIESLIGGDALDERDAMFAIPGVPEQNATLTAVIYATGFVVALVVALFFALLTLERIGLYAVLKATGASDGTLVAGLITQAVTVALISVVFGGVLSFLLGLAVPPEVPLVATVGQTVFTLIAVVIAAVLGGLVSLRRIIRIEPASAIGAGL